MMDLENLLEYLKQPHEAKDIAEMEDIICDIRQLDYFYQQGNQDAIIQLVYIVVNKHKTEADEHDKGRPQAQDIHQLYRSCRGFLMGLGRDRVEKKVRGKIIEESLKHLGGN